MAPDLRASERPIAIACLGFVTFRPDPLFSVPFFMAFISRSTFCEAFGPYWLWLDFLLADFLAAGLLVDFLAAADFLALLDFLAGLDFFVAIRLSYKVGSKFALFWLQF